MHELFRGVVKAMGIKRDLLRFDLAEFILHSLFAH